jgi:ribosomal protein S24E
MFVIIFLILKMKFYMKYKNITRINKKNNPINQRKEFNIKINHKNCDTAIEKPITL